MLAERFIFGTSEYRMAERLFIYRQSDPVIPSLLRNIGLI